MGDPGSDQQKASSPAQSAGGHQPTWTLVVAMADNCVIGRGDSLPWRLSSDLKRFRQRTMGHCLLMGRKTYESIRRPLPGRQNVVLSRSAPSGLSIDSAAADSKEGPFWVRDPREVDGVLQAGRQVMVIGGAQIYRATLERCQTMWITRVRAQVPGDVFFPEIDWTAWQLESAECLPAGPRDDWPTEFQCWRRIAVAGKS